MAHITRYEMQTALGLLLVTLQSAEMQSPEMQSPGVTYKIVVTI